MSRDWRRGIQDLASCGTACVLLALLVYRMLKYNMPYHHTSAAEYDERQHTRILRELRKRATSLGLELVEASTGLVV